MDKFATPGELARRFRDAASRRLARCGAARSSYMKARPTPSSVAR